MYEKAEDAFLLLDAIEEDMPKLRDMAPQIAFEIGGGPRLCARFQTRHSVVMIVSH